MKRTVKYALSIVLSMILVFSVFSVNTFAVQDNYDKVISAIIDGCMVRKTKIDLREYKITLPQMKKIITKGLNNHPEVCLRGKYFTSQYTTDNNMVLILEIQYKYSKSKIDKMQRKIDKKVNKILSKIKPNASDYQKILYIHNYLAKHCKYDKSKKKANVRDIYGCLVKGKALCKGYAQAFEYLLNKLKIKTYYVSSEEMNHGWNKVLLNGNWYNVDVTWDSINTRGKYNKVRRKYFLKSDEEFKKLKHYGGVCFYKVA